MLIIKNQIESSLLWMMNGSAWLADGGLHTFEGRRRIFPGELKGVKISLNRLLQKVNYDMRERERYELMGFKLIVI